MTPWPPEHDDDNVHDCTPDTDDDRMAAALWRPQVRKDDAT